MSGFRKSVNWLLLGGYLLTSTLAASWHDHGECCSHSGTAHHQHCNAGHAGSDRHDHADADDDAGDCLNVLHFCAVCEYLAQAPLAPAIAAPIAAGGFVQQAAQPPVFWHSNALAGTHLPRGPPLRG